MSVIGSNILAGASGQGGDYTIARSLRFRRSASAYLNRTPSASGSQTKFTISVWAKLGQISGLHSMFSSSSATNNAFDFHFSSGQLAWEYLNGSFSKYGVPTAYYRDPSAWYHVVLAVDTSQATAANRTKMYVNGSLITSYAYFIAIPQDTELPINTSSFVARIGRGGQYPDEYLDGYLSEYNFIDGQQLTPSSFGETSATTGVWQPKKYTGSYGTNGFYLPFSDNASTSTLGNDFSGNGNNWTTNNISLTAGSTYDSMTDVPTLTSATAANFCVWNPLAKSSDHSATNGNLTATSSSYGAMCATMGASSGKWYWEMFYSNRTSSVSPVIGFGNDLFNYANPPSGYLGSDSNAGGLQVNNGSAAFNGGSTSYGSAISTNDLVMFAMDLDNRKFYIGKNGTWFNSGNPVTQTNAWPYSANILGSTFFPAVNMYTDTGDTNFGQRPFAYTPPTGFVALNTFNLPTPTIGATASTQANKYFDATTYTGNGSTQTITNAGGFSPDFVWIKGRSDAWGHALYDVIRGVDKRLTTNNTNAESTTATGLTSFNSNGFSISTNGDVNSSAEGYVAWQWDAGGTGVTNTAGTITSTVSANTSAGFSVVTWTGNSTAGATIGHGLGIKPAMIIIKNRGQSNNWPVYHKANTSSPATQLIKLDETSATSSSSLPFNNTEPTSSVVSLGSWDGVNSSSYTYVAYCFSEVAGYSAFGSYTGNGSADGTFVYLGFKPKFVMIRANANLCHWTIEDGTRSPTNVVTASLYPDTSGAEITSVMSLDLLSNGFKCRNVLANESNVSGFNYIYMAFAEVPTKFSLAR